jgi:hypothetical protein
LFDNNDRNDKPITFAAYHFKVVFGLSTLVISILPIFHWKFAMERTTVILGH